MNSLQHKRHCLCVGKPQLRIMYLLLQQCLVIEIHGIFPPNHFLIPRISKHPPPVQQSLIHRLLLPFQKHLRLKYNRRQNISSDNPQEKNKHREWNLHYKKIPGTRDIFECTCFQRQCELIFWYKNIPGMWKSFGTEFELKTEVRKFRSYSGPGRIQNHFSISR